MIVSPVSDGGKGSEVGPEEGCEPRAPIACQDLEGMCTFAITSGSLRAHALVDNVATIVTTFYNEPSRSVGVVYYYLPELYQRRWPINPVFQFSYQSSSGSCLVPQLPFDCTKNGGL